MAADPILPPLITAQLNYLLSHYPLPIKVEQIWSGGKAQQFSDRFTLLIPLCLDYIKWDVIYNAQYPLVAPDVIFGVEDENFHPFFNTGEGGNTKKSCLCDWNCKDPTMLLSLIHELRVQYIVYQRKKVGQLDDERLKFEISTIHPREGIEVYMNSGPDKAEEVKFAVPLLDMDLNKLVLLCPWRHQQKIYLQVIFPVSRKYSPAPTAPRLKLVCSSELKALFSIDDVKLPAWLDGMKATFFASSGIFTFLVHFSLSTQFPKQQPALVLQSSQHFNSQGTPVVSPPLIDYPWSPRWDVLKMAERIFDFLVEECLEFKKYCNDSRHQQY
ncbi:hypothetical protein IFM89_005719 [Coptis chinensis]|uniref:BRISC and BRCA1-A complex member 2 n=1 Tax=Coptis chinensis TaxID=261450 RepID=A0A835M4S6_9MAGN|nr:hypothetical protein IFM89_005719 [Coptis chinensis]